MKRCLVWLMLLTGLLQGEFVFEHDLVELKASPETKEVTALFPFEVRGEVTELLSYDAPCTCLSAGIFPTEADGSTRLRWNPGEKGKVMARFEVGSFKGTQTKSIVLNVAGRKKPVELQVQLHIPVLVEVAPVTHHWELGGEAQERVFDLRVTGSEAVELRDMKSSNAQFECRFETVEAGRHYRVWVRPQSTDKPAFGMIRFQTNSSHERYRNLQLFVVVRKPR